MMQMNEKGRTSRKKSVAARISIDVNKSVVKTLGAKQNVKQNVKELNKKLKIENVLNKNEHDENENERRLADSAKSSKRVSGRNRHNENGNKAGRDTTKTGRT